MCDPVVTTTASAPRHCRGIENYYRFHARIYDATRWSFLFGREALVNLAAVTHPRATRILEIGCGTGRNLVRLARVFPRAQLSGVDLSAAMLAIAGKKIAPFGPRIRLRSESYGGGNRPGGGYDLVVCSYALTMFNPGFEAAIAAAHEDLTPGGHFALVDFHATRFRPFARWMGVNHVRMDGQLRPLLQSAFVPVVDELRPAYGGVWDYLVFVGRRSPSA